jgi:hypothetical protein
VFRPVQTKRRSGVTDGQPSWLAAASDRATLRRSAATSLIVGTLLTVINHGDKLLLGQVDGSIAWRIVLTFVVPFVVATVSAASVRRERRSEDDSDAPGSES